MTSKFTKIFQGLASVVTIVTLVSGFVPAEYKPFVEIFVTISQSIQGILAHYSNPDGTKAEQ